jgi:hypothetical protein
MLLVNHFGFFVFLMLTALVMAQLEVQIEGSAGWAGNLPTWRVENGFTDAVLGGRPLTGYHAFFVLFIALLVHWPYALGLLEFSLGVELRLISFIVLLWLLEDFFWFVINPAYGWRAFRAEHIHWHRKTWWGIMPREYWLSAPLGLTLYVLSHLY